MLHDAVMLNFAKLYRTVAFIKTMVKIMPAVSTFNLVHFGTIDGVDTPAHAAIFLVYSSVTSLANSTNHVA